MTENKMRKITVEELESGAVEKGSMISVKWIDASNHKARLKDHEACPETVCKDWGLYLAISGRKKKMLVLGKDVIEVHNEWGASRIPVDLIEEVILILPRAEVMKAIREVQVLGKKVNLRRYRRKEERYSVKFD